MTETTRLGGCSGWIDLTVVERWRTPPQRMTFGSRLRLAGRSLSNTVRELKKFGAKRSRKPFMTGRRKPFFRGLRENHDGSDTVLRRCRRKAPSISV
jgi:hypothetical protein